MSRTYVIIAASAIPSVDFSLIGETSENTLRLNLAENKAVVKFDSSDPTPSFLVGLTQYTHTEILAIMATSEWSTPQEPPE